MHVSPRFVSDVTRYDAQVEYIRYNFGNCVGYLRTNLLLKKTYYTLQ